MPWDSERHDRFVDALGKTARGELPGYGYPHVIAAYAPRDERESIAAAQRVPSRLSELGLSCEVIPIARYVADAMRRFSERKLSDASEYARLEGDLSDPNVGLVSMTVERLKRDRLSQLSREVVVVLCRLGALHPFAHVSTFLERLYREGIQNPIGVLYPGTADGTRLKFLGLVDPTGGYRGHVVS